MALDQDQKRSFKDRLQDKYRLVILNNENFQEISSHRLSLLNLYIILSSVIVVLGGLLILLIVFTPIKKLIPGYADVGSSKEIIELNKQLDDIIKEKEAQEVYLASFRKMLTSNNAGTDPAPTKEEKLVEAVSNAEIKNQGLSSQSSIASLPIREVRQGSNNYFDLVKPLSGSVSAAFMPEKKHNGVDILAPANTAVKSVLDGYVIISAWNIDTGNTIGVQHADNIVSFYKHNSALLKEEGNFVKAGEALAIIGNSGTLSDGPHLHFELWIDGNPVNPENFIKF